MYTNSKGRPADVLFPAVSETARRRAVDVVVSDPRSVSSMVGNADRVPLASAALKEVKKVKDHQKMMTTHGPGVVTFEKVPFAIESSGAWGKSAIAFWKSLKSAAVTAKLQNYVVSEKPHTWSAFSFQQMVPQKISFVVAKYTAQAIIRGLTSSRMV